MNVRTLCLAILYFREASGYEIRKLATEGEYAYFVDASFGSIYPALAKLEAEGFVTHREVATPGKPSAKMYTITEAGRELFRSELGVKPQRDIFRSEFLLIAMCADILPQSIIEGAIQARRNHLRDEMEHLSAIKGGCEHDGTHWVMDYGLRCLGESLKYLDEHAPELLALCPDAQSDAAE